MQISKFNKPNKTYLPILVQYFDYKEQILVVSKNSLLFVLKNLKLHSLSQFNVLTCISGVDLFGLKYRFCVSYELLSITIRNNLYNEF